MIFFPSEQIISAIQDIVHILITKDYDCLETQGLLGRPAHGEAVTVDEIEEQLEHYAGYLSGKLASPGEMYGGFNDDPATLAPIPSAAFAEVWMVGPGPWTTILGPLDLIATPRLPMTDPLDALHIAVNLWTEEEGQSELNMHVLVSGDPAAPVVQLAYLQSCPLAFTPFLQEMIHALVIKDYEGIIASGRVTEAVLPAGATASDKDKAVQGIRNYVGMCSRNWLTNDDAPIADDDPSLPHLVDMPVQGFRSAHAYAVWQEQTDGSFKRIWPVHVALWWTDMRYYDLLILRAHMHATRSGLVALFDGVDGG